MQTNITAKLKISKLQKNNPIKLLAATIALSASLSAMDPATTFVDDDEAKSASSRGGTKFSQSNGQNNKNQGKGKASLKAAKIVEQTQKTTNSLGDEEELVSTKVKKTLGSKGGVGKVEDAPKAGLQATKEANLSMLTSIKEHEGEKPQVGAEKEEVTVEDGSYQREAEGFEDATGDGEINLGDLSPSTKDEGGSIEDSDELTGGEKEETNDTRPGRGTNPLPYERAVENSESSGIKTTASSATVVSVVGGFAVFVGQYTVSAISYLTPDFVKSFYGNVTTFFGNIRDLCRRIKAPKK